MPGHAKRLTKSMLELIKGVNPAGLSKGQTLEAYVDLFIVYAECDANENRDQNNLCPPIRYYFGIDV